MFQSSSSYIPAARTFVKYSQAARRENFFRGSQSSGFAQIFLQRNVYPRFIPSLISNEPLLVISGWRLLADPAPLGFRRRELRHPFFITLARFRLDRILRRSTQTFEKWNACRLLQNYLMRQAFSTNQKAASSSLSRRTFF